LRDSLEKPVRNDFSSIFEARAQERTCEKPIKTYGFLRFFVSRHIFERRGPLEQKTLEKSPKSTLRSTQNRPKSDQNRSPAPFSSHLGRKSRSKMPFRALLGRLGGSTEPVGATVEATWGDLGSLGQAKSARNHSGPPIPRPGRPIPQR